MAVTEVLVVGGGIGGLTAALCLTEIGRDVRVLERAREFAEIGAGLQLAPNATRVQDRLGVLDRIVALGVLPRRLVLREAIDGGELTVLDLGEDFQRRYGGSYVVLHRSDLLTVLVEACQQRGVGLETGKHVTDIDQTASEATVRCADGSSYRGIAVIGADGLRSTVRAHFSDDQPICSGYVAYRGAVPADQVDATIDPDDVVAWVGPGVHLVQYALRGGAMVNQVAVFRSETYAELVAAGKQPTDEEWGGPDELARAFSRTGSYMQECLKDLWHDKRWPMYDRAPLTSWVDGRIALLGDAAHPMLQYLAQGACQAIEDAAALADAVGQHDDIREALRRFERRRLPHTARVQSSARTWGEIWHVDGVARVLRNELLRERRPEDYRHVDWLYASLDGGLTRAPRPQPELSRAVG